MPHPRDFDPSEGDPLFFYRNFAKHFIEDMIKMMHVGLHIDPDAVDELRKTIDEVLVSVTARLEANDLIKEYQNSRLPEAQRKHAEKVTESLRDVKYYLKEYKPGDMVHRTWVVNSHLKRIGRPDDQQEKWSVSALKKYNVFLKDPFIDAVINKRHLSTNRAIKHAMHTLALYKLDLWNRPRLEKAKEPVELPDFNPGSSKQCKEFFALHKVEPLAYSKDTGEPSWGREQLEIVLEGTSDPKMSDVLEALIDFSFSAIIRNNFLKAFDSYTIDGVLHGNIKIFGAKSFRPTSNSPNLLNAPSSGSRYAEPLKRCIVAPEGKVVYAIDLGALEDRGIANLSGDKNKQNIFLEDLDGHSLNACGYFPDEIAKIMGPNTDNVAYVREFYRLVEDEKHKELKKIRFNSKAPTFKLAYGGYPDAHKGGVITQEIFDNYHNVLYPGITEYRENYVLPTTISNGYIHLGLGCRMYSSNPEQAIRTLNNATVQFWSILTMIAINEFNHRVRGVGLEDDVEVCSTIYDSIYSHVTKDPEILAWVNEVLVEILTVQWLEEEVVRNVAAGDIGYNWADMIKVPNGASPIEISAILEQL
jgi:hypothetical protein